jgi:hypothetical protein
MSRLNAYKLSYNLTSPSGLTQGERMTCPKISYKTNDDAKAAIKAGLQKFKRNNSTPYNCGYCDSFHITTCDSEARASARKTSRELK